MPKNNSQNSQHRPSQNKPTQKPITSHRPAQGGTHIRGDVSGGPTYRIPTPPPKTPNK